MAESTNVLEKLHSVIDSACEAENANVQVLKTGTGNLCAIYFSSNGIFFPDTPECFTETILEKDRYEWKKNLLKKASLHIFVRDLKKSWYLCGINKKYNNIPGVAEHLKELTQGYEIITLGSSAGGFAAVLFGSLLKARRIYSFSGQFEIHHCKNLQYHYLQQVIHLPENEPFLDLKPLLKNSSEIYYFYPAFCQIDQKQAEIVRDCSNVYSFAIDSAEHGVPLSYRSLDVILNRLPKIKKRKKDSGAVYSPDHFFFKYTPWHVHFFAFAKKCIKFLIAGSIKKNCQ